MHGALRTSAGLQAGHGRGGAFRENCGGFPRYHKYTLGTELRNKSREVVALIVRANAARDKQAELLALRDRLEELLILMRMAKEVRAFKSFKSFQFAAGLVDMYV